MENIRPATALRFFAPFFAVEIVGYSLEMVVINIGWGKFVLFSEFSTNILYIVIFTLIMRLIYPEGIYQAWLGFGLYQLFHSVLLHLGYYTGRWLKIEV